MTRAKSVRGIQSVNQSVNRGRVAQYPEARSRTFSWILGHTPHPSSMRVPILTHLCVSQYSSNTHSPVRVPILIQYSLTCACPNTHRACPNTHVHPPVRVPILSACPNTHPQCVSQYSSCCRHGARLRIRVLNSHQRHGRVAVCVDLYRGAAIPESDCHRPAPAQGLILLLGGLANQLDDFARGPCARYSGVLVRFQVPGGKKDQDRARDENEQAEQHGDSQ